MKRNNFISPKPEPIPEPEEVAVKIAESIAIDVVDANINSIQLPDNLQDARMVWRGRIYFVNRVDISMEREVNTFGLGMMQDRQQRNRIVIDMVG